MFYDGDGDEKQTKRIAKVQVLDSLSSHTSYFNFLCDTIRFI